MKSIEHLLKGITGNVYKYTLTLKDLKNKTVIDIPCGDGRMSAVFKELGATVESYDLNSRNNDYIDHEHKFADMNERLPIDSNHADIILCQEGIEHLQDQFFIFSEFNRILKKGGILILTTPSISNLRSKLAYLFMETENFKRLPYNEIDALWRVDRTSNKPKIYFGHLFLITCSKLFTISKINGFRLREQILTKISPSSFFWCILFYPLILLSNAISYLKYLKDNKLRTDVKDNIMRETFLMNINYKTLISKHTFWILEKNMSISETINSLSSFVEEVSKETKSNREVR